MYISINVCVCTPVIPGVPIYFLCGVTLGAQAEQLGSFSAAMVR